MYIIPKYSFQSESNYYDPIQENLIRLIHFLMLYKLEVHVQYKYKHNWSPRLLILKVINNSSSLNKLNHGRDGVWISDLNWHRFLRFYFSVFSLVLVSIEKIYQTLETVFHRLSKQLEFRQKYSAAHRIFDSLLAVWISR